MLACYLNLMSLEDQQRQRTLEEIRDAGYEGVQFVDVATDEEQRECARLGLGKCGSGRVNATAEAAPLASRFRDEGLECATLHVGWGIEDDDECGRLIGAVLEAQARYGVPLYVETHRATVFQDMWRTVQFVRRFPELRFNGDFSHWYTGQEMVYGGFETKLAFIRPVIERVRFVHGRIGNPGSMQVDIGDGGTEGRPYVEHFRTLWRECFRAAPAEHRFLFVPELLSSRIYYQLAGEKTDRWEQSLVQRRIAQEVWAEARGE